MTIRRPIADARMIVLKVGTAVLTGGASEIDRGYLHALAAHITRARERGVRVVVVSSGAVGAGVGALRLSGRPRDVAQLQAAAAAGQPVLMALWREAFGIRGIPVAQILLGRDDFDSRERFLNIRNCMHALLDMGAVPIVNENDTVATEEISLGDNDVLGARLAVAARADALVILTTGKGVLDEGDRVVAECDDPGSLLRLVRPMKTSQGRGGMGTKLEAARIAGRAGVATLIAPGRPVDAVAGILAGESIGTLVLPEEPKHGSRREWIALGATPCGSVTVDAGAARAVRERGASLLARGVVRVEGRFEVGEVIAVKDELGGEIARGLSNLSSDEVRLVQGRESREFEAILNRQSHDELVHRDNLVVLE